MESSLVELTATSKCKDIEEPILCVLSNKTYRILFFHVTENFSHAVERENSTVINGLLVGKRSSFLKILQQSVIAFLAVSGKRKMVDFLF